MSDNCCGLYQGHPLSGKVSCCRSQVEMCGAYAEYGFNGGKGCPKEKGHKGNHGAGAERYEGQEAQRREMGDA